ncbi:hypothetical protein [Gilliamella sp. ESL0250]|uniref:hypothetical protein n=1 Tax=Gilliamella sp. ESL0250 TaxID=2705036 RepID=UPI0015808E3E|nr:hypothetical protein [Gilliamella sp. ESL0250]NUF49926.1 hypothetical protein [Gilliamella sp. ESL0250]
MALLLLSCLWHLPALAGQNGRGNNRSDAIIFPPSSPPATIWFVTPMLFSGARDRDIADMWDRDLGFIFKDKDTNPASYALNFPTAGANGLYFDLVIYGYVDGLTWTPVTHEGITATVKQITEMERLARNRNWFLTRHPFSFVRVTLTGPDASAQRGNPHLSRIPVPRLPQTFELVGRDPYYGEEVIKYGFVLQKWFVHQGGSPWYTYSDTVAWCGGVGYRVPQVKELTNAVCDFHRCEGAVGATPSSIKGNYSSRWIGAGFFTEWGEVFYYRGANFDSLDYWTSDSRGDRFKYMVQSNGHIDSDFVLDVDGFNVHRHNSICVTP